MTWNFVLWIWVAAGVMYWVACMSELGWTSAKGWNPPRVHEEDTWRYRILLAAPICVVFAPVLWLMYLGMVIFDAIANLRGAPSE